ncbi:MAG: thioredoxin family protein [Candidatus Aenigmatarchaeota archaeon]
MRIEILGTGCPKCNKLEENTRKALEELKMEAKIEKVKDISKIIERVAITPALVIDGKVKSEGRIPDVEEIKKWLK